MSRVSPVALAVVAALGCSSKSTPAPTCDSRPQITAINGPSSATAGATVTLTASVTDADSAVAGCASAAASYVWSLTSRPAGSAAWILHPDADTAQFVPDVPGGAYQVQLVVVDATGLESAPKFFTVTASPCGSAAPVVSSVTATPDSVDPGATITLAAVVTDADDACLAAPQARSYLWTVLSRPPGSSAVLSDPAAASPTLVADVPGAYAFQLVVTDATDRSSAPAFVNASASRCSLVAPSIAPLAPVSAVQLAAVTLPAPAVSDLNCVAAAGQLAYRWSIVAAPAGSGAVVSDPAARTPILTPDVPGVYQLSVVATNSEGIASTPAFLDVAVAPCGTAALAFQPIAAAAVDPELGPLPTGAVPSVGARITLATQAIDPNVACGALVAPIAYRWTLVQRPAGSGAALAADAGASASLVPDVQGSYEVAVTATDALGNASVAPQVFALTTSGCGANAPVVTVAPAGAVAADEYAPQAITASVVSADDAPSCPPRFHVAPGGYAVAWSIASQPASGSATLSSATGATTTFEAFTAGTYVVRATATAPDGLTSSAASPASSLAIAVAPCGGSAPSIASVGTYASGTPTPISRPQVGQPTDLVAFATDPDVTCGAAGARVASYAFAAVSLPAGSAAPASASSGSGVFTFTPDVYGTYVYRVTATDDVGLSSAPVDVTLQTAACGPVVSALTVAPGPLAVGSPVTVSPLSLTDGCIVSPTFSYGWSLTQRPAGSQAILAPASTAAAFTPDVAGTYQVQLVVTDSAGLASAPAVVTVQAAGPCGPVPPAVATNGYGVADFRATQLAPSVNGTFLAQTHATDPSASSASGAGTFVVPFYPGVPVQLAASVVPAGGCPTSYAWSLVGQPAGSAARLDSPNAASPSFTPDLPGAYAFQLTLTDPTGRSTTSGLVTDGLGRPVVTVGSCGLQAPVVQLAALPVAGGVQLDAAGTFDPDATPYPAGCGLSAAGLTYAWSIVSAPAGSTASVPSQPEVDPSFAAIPGTYVIALAVGHGAATTRQTVSATVTATPAVSTAAPASAAIFTGSATDLQGNPVVAIWDNVSGTVSAARCTAACGTATPTWASLGTIDSGLGPMAFGADDEPRPVAVAVGGTGGVPGVGNVFVAYHTGPDLGGTTTAGMQRCGIAVAEWDGSAWNRAPVIGASGCDAAATAGVGFTYGRWLSLVTNASGAPLLGFSATQGVQAFPAYGACSGPTCGTTLAGAAFQLSIVKPPSSGTERTGRWTSLALSGDDVHAVSYSDDDGTGQPGLVYSSCAGCASPAVSPLFTSVKIDGSATSDVGRFSSVAVLAGPSGRALLAASRDASTATARWASCPLSPGAPCTSAAVWRTGAITDPANAADYGRDTVLVADPSGNGSARVAYLDSTDGAVRLLSADAQGTFAPSRATAGAASTPAGLSIAFGDGSFTCFGASGGGASVSPAP